MIFIKNFKGEIIIRPMENNTDTLVEIGNSIHRQLYGNQDYIESNIVINLLSDGVMIRFYDCEGEIPDIVF